MPLNTLRIWNSDAGTTTRCMLLPTNDYYRQCYDYPNSNYLPAGWQLPGFNDSGWSAPLNPGGVQLSNGFGPYTADTGKAGYWPVNTAGSTNQGCAFRFQFSLPPDINIIYASVDMWFCPSFANSLFVYDVNNNFNSNTSHVPTLSDLYLRTRPFLNGIFVSSPAYNAAQLVPGATNLAAIWFDRPWPATCFGGGITVQLAGCASVYFLGPSNCCVGWAISITYSTPIDEGPAEEVSPAIVGPAVFTQITTAPLLHCPQPIETSLATAWDGSQSRGRWGSFVETTSNLFGTVPTENPPWVGPPTFQLFFLNTVNRAGVTVLAQGFQAQWTTLQRVEIYMSMVQNSFDAPKPFPGDWTLYLDICEDNLGVPGAVMATTQITPATDPNCAIQLSYGQYPAIFEFPDIPLTIQTNYWLQMRVNGTPTDTGDPVNGYGVGVNMGYWQCNGTQPAGVNPVVYGFASQGYQAMWQTGNSNGQWLAIEQFHGATPGGHCDPAVWGISDPAQAWAMAISGEGLYLSTTSGSQDVSCPPNGMGIAGRRDPNTDNFANNAEIRSTWNSDGAVFTLNDFLGDPQDAFNATQTGVVFTAEDGKPWGVYYVQFQSDGAASWGAFPASRFEPALPWPWPRQTDLWWTNHFQAGDQVSGPYVHLAGGFDVSAPFAMQAVIRPNGSILALFNGFTADPNHRQPDPLIHNALAAVTWVQVQFADGSYGPVTELHPSELSASCIGLDAINDAAGNTHVFMHDWDPLGLSLNSTVGPMYHCIVYQDGTVGPLQAWDCALSNIVQRGKGCMHPPSGGVIYPYARYDAITGNASLLAAVFYQDGTGPDTQQIPSWGLGIQGVAGSFAPGPDGRIFGFFPNPHVIIYHNAVGYLFVQDGVGASVARTIDISDPVTGAISEGWSGLAPWNTTYPLLGPPNFPGPIFEGPGGITANVIESRDQIAVISRYGSRGWFYWFDDTLDYPPINPRPAQALVNCLGRVIGGAQVIG